ncbi:MAG TPA: hypothetical protein VFP87_02675 [Chitinophagaceae bacterium]|nr:hypothetical protein [Chitinophagaceae bacterium]
MSLIIAGGDRILVRAEDASHSNRDPHTATETPHTATKKPHTATKMPRAAIDTPHRGRVTN